MNKPPSSPLTSPNKRPQSGPVRRDGAPPAAATIFDSSMPGVPARRAALDVLRLVRHGDTLDAALGKCHSFDQLVGPDRGFARHLASSALRHQGSMDDIIGHFLDRPLPARSREAMDILRLVGVQCLVMDIADHAVVATAVALSEQKQEIRGFKGLINAVARKIVTRGPKLRQAQPSRVNTPSWLWRSWERQYGAYLTQKIAAAHTKEAPLDLSLKDVTQRDKWADLLGATPLGPCSLRLRDVSGSIDTLAGYDDGAWWVQDVSATLPVHLLGDVAGKHVVDLCAAPGGKTMQFAAAGAHVTAVERVPTRASRLDGNLDRTQLKAKTVLADACTWRPEEPADIVLLDAPCTATGTIRRNPDVLWTPKDLAVLQEMQRTLLDNAVACLAPGGTLLYSTCSLLREEGEEQAEKALARHENLAFAPFASNSLPTVPDVISAQGYLRALPCHLIAQGGMDGFFAARFTKR